jgi:CheY-like chemotaxis protein/predicted regulator of Ras-like GTPase activity (Roadblock/LC7/MglB family)
MAKVLVVDDSVSVRKVVERALQTRSIDVVSAACGEEAIERLDRERPDAVVCDVILPDRDGYEVCQYVRAHPGLGKTPFLLISGVVNGTVLSRAAEVQSTDVMFKPFTADELATKIGQLLAARGANGHPTPGPAPVPVAAPAPPPFPAPVPEPRPVVSVHTPMPAPAQIVAAPTAAPGDLASRLATFVGSPGVRFAALVDREGFLIESAGETALEADVAGALASCLAESSEGIGRDLGHGALLGMILEYEGGMVLLHGVGPSALLVIVLRDPAALGKVRYYVKKTLPELMQVL